MTSKTKKLFSLLIITVGFLVLPVCLLLLNRNSKDFESLEIQAEVITHNDGSSAELIFIVDPNHRIKNGFNITIPEFICTEDDSSTTSMVPLFVNKHLDKYSDGVQIVPPKARKPQSVFYETSNTRMFVILEVIYWSNVNNLEISLSQKINLFGNKKNKGKLPDPVVFLYRINISPDNEIESYYHVDENWNPILNKN